MLKLTHERKGQAVTSEFVLLFFVAISGISAMTLYVQRTLQARQRDAEHYMVDMASNACNQATVTNGVDCLGAAGGTAKLAYQYEPYYTQSSAKVARDSGEKKVINDVGTWGKYTGSRSGMNVDSVQKPPKEAN